MDQKTVEEVEDIVIRENSFRNKSHFIEVATQKLLEEGRGV